MNNVCRYAMNTRSLSCLYISYKHIIENSSMTCGKYLSNVCRRTENEIQFQKRNMLIYHLFFFSVSSLFRAENLGKNEKSSTKNRLIRTTFFFSYYFVRIFFFKSRIYLFSLINDVNNSL